MTQDKNDLAPMGLARKIFGLFGFDPIEEIKPVEAVVQPLTRLQTKDSAVQDALTVEARGICASVAEKRGTAMSYRYARSIREGAYDDDEEMQIAKAALLRGIEIGHGQ